MPRAAPAAAPAPARRARPAARRRPAAPPAVAHEEEEEIHLGVDDDEAPILDTDEPVAAPEKPVLDLDLDAGMGDDLAAQFIDDDDLSAPAAEDSVAIEEELVLDEDAAPLSGLEEAVEEEIRATASPGIADDLGLEEDIDFEAAEPPPPPTVAPLAARHVAERAPDADAPDELAQILGEVDSYISLGFVDDAKEALREARRALRRPPGPRREARRARHRPGRGRPEDEAGLATSASDPFESLDLGRAEEPAAAP